MEDNKYIKKWLADDLNEKEKQAFESNPEFLSLTRMERALLSFKAPEYPIEEELQKSYQRRKQSWVAPWMKIAASFLLLAVIVYLLLPSSSMNALSIVANNTKSVILPDSSTVILNKGSILSYDPHTWKNQREVILHGEGFFEVKRGSSFKVSTPQGTVKVLGTVFNVKAWDSYFTVDCYLGKVAVKTTRKETILTAHQRVRYIDGQGGEIERFRANEPAWINGESHFEGVPIQLVLKELERQYEIKVDAKDIDANQKFSGSFTHGDLALAIKSITVPLNLRYEINDSTVTLLRETTE